MAAGEMINIKTLQNQGEFNWFLDILRREDVRSYLEIGSKWGGSLLQVAAALPVPSRLVSVDLPWGMRESTPVLQGVVHRLQGLGHEVHLFLGDSTDESVIGQVRALSPYDVVFIDANHTLPFVKSDWMNYGPMGRIVAFHDISWKPRANKPPIEVPKFWEQIKHKYRHEQIQLEARDNGIGVLWRC
jgi:predicted O-methyltransferase YrrM